MRLSIGLPLLCLLAARSAGAATPNAAVRAGSLEIDLDPGMASFLPVDVGVLQAGLCGGAPPVDDWPKIAPRGECDLSVAPPPRMGLFVDETGSAGGAALWATVELRGSKPWQGGAPIRTDCGLWDVTMEIVPDAGQPSSQLLLEPSVANPTQGAFAGVLRFAVRYRFAHRESGLAYELPADHALELAGHWAAVPAGTPGLADGASNLMLFAGSFAGEWLHVPACGGWAGLRCRVCFRAPPEGLERLNAGLGR